MLGRSPGPDVSSRHLVVYMKAAWDVILAAHREEVIINCPPAVQLCAMSATVANAQDLGDWIHEVGILHPVQRAAQDMYLGQESGWMTDGRRCKMEGAKRVQRRRCMGAAGRW